MTVPGQILCASGSIKLNCDRELKQITVANTGDRPIQVGSHYHFFEVNKALKFDRVAALGFRLDIPAGTAVRFEPGDTKQVQIVAMAGNRQVYGLNNLVDGDLDNEDTRRRAIEKMLANGFSNQEEQ
ncbi:urease subunit beta [Chlorogloea sp. CCALA 695]|uniref:urease subunit beta n=1 Tax=Chlorogloea sp. CCALA 695 TaxID=2107693 RepID=UPI000D0591E6|nr:urease subunit beta [Chlorogloea sp. CCALA 695]PSB30243.1 urease subunit beta [Chlorogloea sp. CCALA 695]